MERELRHNIWKLAFGLTAACCFSICIAAKQQDQIKRMVFVQSSDYATLEHTGKSHNYKLTMHLAGNNPQVVYVSEHPNRVAGSISVKQFLTAWNDHPNGFKNKPPLAALVYDKFKSKKPYGIKVDVVSLAKPDYDSGDNTVSYQVTSPGNYTLQEGKYTGASLIIDRIIDIG